MFEIKYTKDTYMHDASSIEDELRILDDTKFDIKAKSTSST